MNTARTLLISSALWGCSDAGVKAINAEPEAEITSHSDGAEVLEGYTVTFRGTVSDPDHSASELTATWLSDAEVLCESAAPDDDGISTCEASIPSTLTTLVLEVQDPENAGGSDQIQLSVVATESPVAQITAPSADGIFYSDQLITFEGLLSDGEDLSTDLVAGWESSIDGALDVEATPNADGAVTGFGYLTEGEHAVQLWVEDSVGKTGSDSVIIEVGPPNSAPSCEITAPDAGAMVAVGELVDFSATVADVDISADWLGVAWESDKDGELGSSTPSSDGEVLFSTADLSVETHTVTMTVSDEVGATCTDLVQVLVGTPPSISIDSPVDGAVINEGELVVFEGTVVDAEELASELSLSWSSSLDGEFSTQSADSTGQVVFSAATLGTATHLITVTATDSTGLTGTDAVTLTINGLPSEPVVSIGPDPATTSDDLVVSVSGSTDPEGDLVSYDYAWTVDGVATSTSSSDTVSTSDTTKGQLWSVTVTPTDGWGSGPSGTASITVSNEVPVVSGVSISPDPAVAEDSLVCSYTFSDADGDSDASTLEWTDGSTIYGTEATLSGGFSGGNTLTCTVTPSDGEDAGVAESATITISNTAPEITDLGLSPTVLYTEDTVAVTVTSSDPDADTVSYRYEWYVDGVMISSATGASLYGGSYFDKDQEVYVVVTPNDGTEDGTAVSSDSIIVSNSLPTEPEISIDPEEPMEGEDDLVCWIDVDSVDDDGDTVIYTLDWTVDGVSYSASNTTIEPGDTILAGEIYTGETWVCSVTPDDGTESGDSGFASVIIGGEMGGHDADGDGFTSDVDCDDSDPSTYPGAGDFYDDGVDSDCDGLDCNADFSGSTYFAACPDAVSWIDAETLCIDAGYDGLATVLDSTENSDITGLLYVDSTPDNDDLFWVGFNDNASEGTWVWSSGVASSYTNWNSGEPNNSAAGSGEDCAQIYSNVAPHALGYWNDFICTEGLSYVCEMR